MRIPVLCYIVHVAVITLISEKLQKLNKMFKYVYLYILATNYIDFKKRMKIERENIFVYYCQIFNNNNR